MYDGTNWNVPVIIVVSVWYKTKFGSQNFGYQIWFCTRLIMVMNTSHTVCHYSDVKWQLWHCDLPFNRVFVQQFVKTNSKGTLKVRVTVPLWDEATGLRGMHRSEGNSPVDSPHKESIMRKMFPFDDVIMILAGTDFGFEISWWTRPSDEICICWFQGCLFLTNIYYRTLFFITLNIHYLINQHISEFNIIKFSA